MWKTPSFSSIRCINNIVTFCSIMNSLLATSFPLPPILMSLNYIHTLKMFNLYPLCPPFLIVSLTDQHSEYLSFEICLVPQNDLDVSSLFLSFSSSSSRRFSLPNKTIVFSLYRNTRSREWYWLGFCSFQSSILLSLSLLS